LIDLRKEKKRKKKTMKKVIYDGIHLGVA